jgi:hypothetical protein
VVFSDRVSHFFPGPALHCDLPISASCIAGITAVCRGTWLPTYILKFFPWEGKVLSAVSPELSDVILHHTYYTGVASGKFSLLHFLRLLVMLPWILCSALWWIKEPP